MWRALLSLILFVWYPANFAAELATVLPSIDVRGPLAVVEVVVHAAAAVLSVAAGLSLWTRRPHGPPLACAALVAGALVSIQSLYWSTLPSQTKPGDELPLAAFAVAHAGAWLIYLRRAASVRAGEP